MTRILKKVYTYPGIILFYILLVSAAGLFFLDKGNVIVVLNQYHNNFFDVFFRYFTFLGDGLMLAFLLVFFLLRSYYFSMATVYSIILQTVLIQGIKNLIFPNLVRPALFFKDFAQLHAVQGVEVHAYHTFPSGHTATAFTVALLLSIYFRNKNWSILLFLLASVVALSRMYLLQHFFVDVYFGSVIGVFSVLATFYLLAATRIKNTGRWRNSLLKRN